MPDLSDNSSTTATLVLGSSISSTVDFAGDMDWFAVNLVTGYTYIFALFGSSSGRGTLFDPVIVGLFHSNGTLYDNTSNDDYLIGSRDSQITYTPADSGTYYLSAGGYGVGTGSYQLGMTIVDLPASTQTATLSLGVATAGVIDFASDVDWFKVELAGGVGYVITDEGSATGKGTLVNPRLMGVYNSASILLSGSGNDDYGGSRNSRVLFTPPSSGTYYVAAASASNTFGSYSLSINFANAAAAVTVGSTSSTGGSIAVANETDWYKVYLVANTTFYFNMVGQENGGGTLFDPEIIGLFLPNGAPAPGTSNDNYSGSRNAFVSYSVPDKSSGTYYLAVSGHGRNTGSYSLLLSSADGLAANTTTSGTLTLGTSQSGLINEPGDVDWLRVVLAGGVTYTSTMNSTNVQYGSLYDPNIIGVYSSSGVLFANTGNNNFGNSRNARASFTPSNSGTYYVAVSASGNGVGSYTLNTQFIGAAMATPLAVGGQARGSIAVRDEVDWFRVELQGGASYTLNQRGSSSSAGTLFDPQLLGIYSSSGLLIPGTANDNTNASRDAAVYYSPTTSGTYYVAARGHGIYTGSYTMALTMTDQAPATTATTATVTLDSNLSGTINFANDVDWVKMSLLEGVPYAISQWGSPTGQGTLANPYIYGLYNAGGSLLANTGNDNYGGSNNARVFYTPPTSGTYYAALRGSGSRQGSYTVGLDLALELSPTSLALNTPLTRSISSSGEVDWYVVSLIGGMAYAFQQSTPTTGRDALADPKIQGLYTRTGSLIEDTSNDNISLTNANAKVTYTPVASGTYYLAVSAGGSGTGNYTLAMQTDELPATPLTQGYVSVNSKVASSIEVSGDVDWLAIIMYKDVQYNISLNGSPTNQGTLRDSVLKGLYTYNGALLGNTGNDNYGTSSNAFISYTPTYSALYYISVGGKGALTGTYTLEVRSPDVPANMTTSKSLAVGGTVYNYIDQVGDSDWFAISLVGGRYYTVVQQGLSLSDTYLLGVYSTNDVILANTVNNNISTTNPDSQVVFLAPSSGTYYIAAGANGDKLGSYSLTLQSVALPAASLTRTSSSRMASRSMDTLFQPAKLSQVLAGNRGSVSAWEPAPPPLSPVAYSPVTEFLSLAGQNDSSLTTLVNG